MPSLRRAALIAAFAAVPLAAVLPLAAQTPTTTPSAGATPSVSSTPTPAGAGLVFATPTASPSPAPNPLAPYNPFLLAAILQQSDLPQGDLIFLQTPLQGSDLADMFSDVNVTAEGAFLQEFGPLEGAETASGGALGVLLGAGSGEQQGMSGLFILGSQADATTLLDAFQQAGTLGSNDASVSNIQLITPPAVGDQAIELQATQTFTDDTTGATTTTNIDAVAARRDRVLFIVESIGPGGQQQAAEALAKAMDARVQKALPLLPAQ